MPLGVLVGGAGVAGVAGLGPAAATCTGCSPLILLHSPSFHPAHPSIPSPVLSISSPACCLTFHARLQDDVQHSSFLFPDEEEVSGFRLPPQPPLPLNGTLGGVPRLLSPPLPFIGGQPRVQSCALHRESADDLGRALKWPELRKAPPPRHHGWLCSDGTVSFKLNEHSPPWTRRACLLRLRGCCCCATCSLS